MQQPFAYSFCICLRCYDLKILNFCPHLIVRFERTIFPLPALCAAARLSAVFEKYDSVSRSLIGQNYNTIVAICQNKNSHAAFMQIVTVFHSF